MKSIEREIGSAHNLVVFEAAARHLSFSLAAGELGVSQPAVSQSVARLEQALGARLFRRSHRQIALTDAGELFAREVADALARIGATARQIRRGAAADHVTLIVSTAFAAWWMVPRLARFRARHPGIDLRLQTVDRDLDISAEASGLAVRRGAGVWPGYDAAMIAPERLSAVTSPALRARLPVTVRSADIPGLPLIHLDEPHRVRPGWSDYLGHLGIAYRDKGEGLRLNDYALVVQAAMAGQGVALGWQHICAAPMAQGLLCQVVSEWVDTGTGFWLVWSSARALHPDTRLTRDFILASVTDTTDILA